MPSSLRRFAILCPMKEEMDAVLALGTTGARHDVLGFEGHEMTCFAHPVLVVRCGVGKVHAAMTAQRVIDEFKVDAIIVTGVAGALAPDLEPGDAVVARDVIQHDMDCTALGFARGEVPFTGERIFTCDPTLVASALTAKVGHKLRAGRILAGDRFVTHSDKECHAYMTGELAGDAVEMEGAAVGQVCARNKIPFVVVRTISDRADGAAPEDFSKILPLAAANAAAVTRKILER
jgi:adenosylhomocysteine nucleosidase